MKTKILAALLLGASALSAAPRFAIGIGVGVPYRPYYAPAPVYSYAPPPVYNYAPAYVAPYPGYAAGYWYGYGPNRVWRTYRVEPRREFRGRR
jgi:hypothetical protein